MPRSPSVPVLLVLLVAPQLASAAPAAKAGDEPLWTEGTGRGPAVASPSTALQSFVKLAKSLGPTVVHIIAISQGEPGGGPAAGDDRPRPRGRGQGTGFLIHKSGFLLTNAHVVDNADDIRVRLADERELTARLVGRDERTDIALLKIDNAGDLPVATLGNSDEVQIGEWVIAIGNPFGLDHTVTAGIVSAKGRRDVRPGGPGAPSQTGFYDFIQTDASINPGNSGGPLINTRGEVIGINTAMNAQAQGIGFAIPINMVKVIVPLLAKHGRAPRSWLGVFPQTISAALKRAFSLPDQKGALLADVVAESPAARAGLEAGDVVVEFDGRPVRRADDLTWFVSTTLPGRKVAVSALRRGRPLKVEIELVAAQDNEQPRRERPAVAPPSGRKSPLGMTVSEISSAIAQELGNPKLHGVVVMSVEPDSPAIEAGVERGDVILRVGETIVGALDDYAAAVRKVPSSEMLRLLLRRDGKNLWVAFPKR
jgi:serine protease Do